MLFITLHSSYYSFVLLYKFCLSLNFIDFVIFVIVILYFYFTVVCRQSRRHCVFLFVIAFGFGTVCLLMMGRKGMVKLTKDGVPCSSANASTSGTSTPSAPSTPNPSTSTSQEITNSESMFDQQSGSFTSMYGIHNSSKLPFSFSQKMLKINRLLSRRPNQLLKQLLKQLQNRLLWRTLSIQRLLIQQIQHTGVKMRNTMLKHVWRLRTKSTWDDTPTSECVNINQKATIYFAIKLAFDFVFIPTN